MSIKITPGIILKQVNIDLEFEPLEGGELIEEHFLKGESNDELDLTASDLYVKDTEGRTIEISADFSGLIYKII